MTIDERLEKLTERHVALTATVELLAAEIRDVVAVQQQHEKMFGQHEKMFGKHEKMFGEVMEGIARLLHIAEIHEQRLSNLEGD